MKKKTTSAKKSLYTPEAEALLDKIFGSAESAEASEIKEEINMTKENISAKKVNLQKVDTAAAESVDTAQDNISVYDLIPSVDELNDVEIDEATESVDTAATESAEPDVTIEVDEAAAAEAIAKAAKKAAKKAKVKLRYKNGRWVKVTQDAGFIPKRNEMRLLLNEDQTYATADLLLTANTSTFSKAAYWLIRYLGHAEAADIIALAQSMIESHCVKADNTPGAKKISFKGAGWLGTIEKVAKGQFKCHVEWQIAA